MISSRLLTIISESPFTRILSSPVTMACNHQWTAAESVIIVRSLTPHFIAKAIPLTTAVNSAALMWMAVSFHLNQAISSTIWPSLSRAAPMATELESHHSVKSPPGRTLHVLLTGSSRETRSLISLFSHSLFI